MSASPAVWYVYGVVPPTLDIARAPEGLEDAPLQLVREGPAAGLASMLDGARYAPEPLERSTENVEWLAPRAVAHDRVLTWASDRAAGAVVPFPMFSLFSSEDAVRGMLRDRTAQLAAALQRAAEGREYVLRVYRIDSELADVAVELSPRLAELQRTADSAAPGQGYLLRRKLDAERKTELRLIGERVARDAFDLLSALALAATESPTPHRPTTVGSTPAERGTAGALVLDAAFLVTVKDFARFQREITSLVGKHERRGFHFDFTGPWPPYHFVQDVGGATGAATRDG
jgi:hypothetical protein